MRIDHARAGSLYTPEGQRKYIAADERRRFLAAAVACPRLEIGTLCLTLTHTGCRISEALAIVPTSIIAAEGFVSVRSLKKRAGALVYREIPVPTELIAALRVVHQLDVADRNVRLWRLSRSSAWELVKAVMKEAGIADGPHATPKGLRHGFGIHAIRSGIPITMVQKWLGHARLETTAIYLQAMGIEEREIAARMWTKDSCPLIGAPAQLACEGTL